MCKLVALSFMTFFLIVPGMINVARANVASSDFVEEKINTRVALDGDQDIGGTKTYALSPVIPTPDLPAPQEDQQEQQS